MSKFYIDTDFLINLFICPRLMELFEEIYKDSEFIIPYYVKQEIFCDYMKSNEYKNKYNEYKENYNFKELDCFEIDSHEFNLYAKLTSIGCFGYSKAVGKGEASCIALAKIHDAILASNNLSDIKIYSEIAKITYITTSDLINLAYKYKRLIDQEAEIIWSELIKKGRFMPCKTFKQFKEKKNA